MFKNTETIRKGLLASAAIISTSAGIPELAHAQVDEIIITATKSEKSLQDVPISVTALNVEALDSAAVTNLESLQFSVPGLSMTTASGSGFASSIRMRGVGTSGTNLGFEGSVGVFVDGVYRPRVSTSLGDFADVERVEVLRGPQGTLFGRNTTAGAISLITKKPELNEFGGSVRATFGNYDRTQLRGILNLPLVEDQMAARFSVDFNKRDGFLENIIDGVDDLNDRDRVNLRGQLLWEPNPDMEVRVIGSYFTAEETCCGAVTFSDGGFVTAGNAGGLAAFGIDGPIAPDASQREDFLTARDTPTIEEQDEASIQVDFDWDLGGGINFFNTISYSDYEVEGFQDADQTGLDFTDASPNGVTVASFTEEFRFSGSLNDLGVGQGGSWILGGYYSEEELGQDYQLTFGPDAAVINALLAGAGAPGFPPFGFTPGDTQRSILSQDATVYAAFGHLDLDLSDQFNLSGGLRYSSEDKTGRGDFTTTTGALLNPFILPGALNFEADEDVDKLTYNAALTYKWTDDVSTYASFAHGYKSGGVNLDVLGGQAGTIAGTPRALVANGFASFDATVEDPTFPVEEVDTFELGLKSRFWDGRATLNLTGFHSTFTDFQVLQFTGTGFNILAAPEVTTKGVEGEMQINPVEGLDIGVQYTYADASYTEPFLLGDSQLDGLTINNAPKHSGAINATYSRSLGGNFKGFVNGGWSYEGSYIASAALEADRQQDAYSIFMGRVGVSTNDDKYGVEIWCRNCGDEAVNQIIFSSPIADDSTFGFIHPPREYGVTLTSRF